MSATRGGPISLGISLSPQASTLDGSPGHGPCSETKVLAPFAARRQPEERHMALATQDTGRSRARLARPAPGHLSTRIEIVENPIAGHDPRLGAEVEEVVQ